MYTDPEGQQLKKGQKSRSAVGTWFLSVCILEECGKTRGHQGAARFHRSTDIANSQLAPTLHVDSRNTSKENSLTIQTRNILHAGARAIKKQTIIPRRLHQRNHTMGDMSAEERPVLPSSVSNAAQ